jgi:hypothetical protein
LALNWGYGVLALTIMIQGRFKSTIQRVKLALEK